MRAISRSFCFMLLCLILSSCTAQAQVSILTQRYDSARDGVNASETTLTPTNVNTATFGKLFSLPVDGRVFAQPLYVPNVTIPGAGVHNVLYAATQHDSVYAFDADGLQIKPLWTVNLATSSCPVGWTCTSVPASAGNRTTDIIPEIGITSTPVIDPITGTLFVIAKTQEVSGSITNFVYRLHALDITTGAERPGSPVVIQGQVPGTGNPNSGGSVSFSPLYSLQRPGLVLANNAVYVAFGSWGDVSGWHGWVFGYDESSLSQTAAFSTTPNGSEGEGGIWMHGNGLAADQNGNLFFSTGNGGFDGIANYSDSFLKLVTPGLTVSDYFAPYNQSVLDSGDLDIASGGLMLLPPSAGTTEHPDIMMGCGKNGAVYVIDRDNMGGYNSSNDSQIVQELLNVVGGTQVSNTSSSYVENCYSSPAYWEGNVYWGGIGDSLKMFSFTNGLMSTSPVSHSSEVYQFPGASPVVSADGSSQGIVWTVEDAGSANDLDNNGTTAILHAYDATNLANELYNSGQASSDFAGTPVKFAIPVVANGKVYVGTQSSVAVYGLFSSLPQASAPAFSPGPGTYGSAVSVSISDTTPGTTIYYTLDGMVPTAGSSVYSGPIVLTANATLSALALADGYRESAVTAGNYVVTNGAAVSFVQGNYANSQNSLSTETVVYSKAQVAGDLNVIVVGWKDSTATVMSGGVTDSAGNTYALAVGPTVLPGYGTQAIYYAINIHSSSAGANTVTVKFSAAASAPDVRILEYGGIDLSSPLDAIAATSGYGITSTVNLTTANSTDVILGANLVQTATSGAGPGFTKRMITSPNGDIVEDEAATIAGTYTVSAPLTPTYTWIMQAVAFRVVGSGPNPAPTVAALSPVQGSTAGGTAVTITGTNFVTGATVTIGGTAATNVVVVGSTQITAATPAGAAGPAMVTVTNPDSQTGSLTSGFTYVVAPAVTSVSPNSGPSTGGTAVTITGGNFASGATVTFGGTAATNVVVVSSTQITATTPAGGAGPATLTVTAGGESGSLTNGFTYTVTVPPTVTGISPNSGLTAGGTSVTITGTGFAPGATVTFGSAAASNVNVISSTTIAATAPANPVGPVTATVTDFGGLSGSLQNGFTYTAPTTITYVQGAYATPQSSQTTVSVTFPAAQTAGDLNVVVVGWNDVTHTVASITDTEKNAYSLAVGPTQNAAGTISQSIYYAKNIASAPAGGNTVSITFSGAAAYPDIRILEYSNADTNSPVDIAAASTGSGTASSVTASSATTNANDLLLAANTITTTTTSAGAGFTSRMITSPDGDIAEDRSVNAISTYSATASMTSGQWIMQMVAFKGATGLGGGTTPTVVSVTPNSGPATGGTPVTITGTNFAAPATVTIGGAAASNVVVASSTQITATTPAGSAGSATVTVTVGGQSGSLSSAFTYGVPATVSSISPSSGSTAGGTAVTITGTNFAAGATVTIGPNAATNVVVVSSTQITATTPAGTAGAATVTITIGGQSGSLSNAFTYVAPATVSSISPSSGSTAGGTAVTITGTNFAAGATVTIGANAATNAVIVSATQITAATPAGSAGAATVTVTNPGVQGGSLVNGFTYAAPPTVSGISPNSGPTAGGTAVTITGAGFVSGATVKFENAAATAVLVTSSTTITATTPANAVGAVTVTVGEPGGVSGRLQNAFTYTASTPASITYVQGAYATPQSPQATVSVTYAQAQNAGDLNVVVVGWNDSAASVTSVTDTSGTPYTLAIGPTKISGALSQSIYYLKNIPAAAAGANTVKVTFSAAAAYPDIRILEYYGADPNNPIDVTAAATGSGGTSSSGSATTTNANDLIFGANIVTGETSGPGTGFTQRLLTVPDSDIAEDKSVTAAGSYSATAPASGQWIMQMVALRVNGSGGVDTTPPTAPSGLMGPNPQVIAEQGYDNPTFLTTHTTAAFDSTGGDMLVLFASSHAGVNMTPSDTYNNTWISIAGPTNTSTGFDLRSQMWYVKNPIVGPGETVSVTLSTAESFVMSVFVVKGSNVPSPLDAFSPIGDDGGTQSLTVASPNIQSAIADDLLLGWAKSSVSETFTSGTGFTPQPNASGPFLDSESEPVAAPGAYDATFTLNTAATWQSAVVAVEPPVTAASVKQINLSWTASTDNVGVTAYSVERCQGNGCANFKQIGTTPSTTYTDTGLSPSTVYSYRVRAADAAGNLSAYSNVVVASTQAPQASPTVTSVSPNSGSTSGGMAITITGTNFASGATVTIGGAPANNVVVVSATQITATTPVGAAGAATVTVTNAGSQSGSLTNGFTYIVAPAVNGLSPNSGPATGGTSVTITGTNFASGATVTIGGAAATNIVVVSSTQITATTPAGAAGPVSVTVTVNGQTGSLTNSFTYIAPATVSSISPNTGSTSGGTAVTITGTNFATGATVKIGANAATNVVVVSATQITATTPAGTSGSATVTITNPGVSGGNLTNGFTYVATPTVSSISPNSGPSTGGTAVTITGANFASAATVTVGGTAATNVAVVSSTQITATTPSGAAGAATVAVTVNGQTGTLLNGFTYTSVVPISYSQVAASTPQSATSTITLAYPAAETAGDLNIVVVGWNDTTATVQSVTDSAGNKYTLAIGPTSGTALRQSIYYASNIAGGTDTVTVQFSQAAAYPDVRVLEYRGVSTLDVTAGTSGSGTAASSGSATTTSANELIVAADTISTTTTGAGSGFTSRIVTSPDSDLVEDKTATATGSYSATASLTSGYWIIQMVAFK